MPVWLRPTGGFGIGIQSAFMLTDAVVFITKSEKEPRGKKIVIEGRIQPGSYTNQDGAKVYTTDIVVESMEFAESRRVEEAGNAARSESATDENGFMNVPDGVEDDGLPFN